MDFLWYIILTVEPAINVKIDAVGLTLSIISMLLLILAIFRDHVFREKETGELKPIEGGK